MQEPGWLKGDQVGHIHPTAIIYPDVAIGPNVTIYPYAVIGRPPQAAGQIPPVEAQGVTTIGGGSVIGAHVTIYRGVTLRGDNLIGDGVVIREDCDLGPQVVIGQNATIQPRAKIGARSRVLDLAHVTADVEIGEDVFWSVNVLALNDDSMNRGGDLRAPSVGHRARIGAGAVILPGRRVGDDAVVGAGAVVTHDVRDAGEVRGIPARPLNPAAPAPEPPPYEFHDMFGGYDGRFEPAKAEIERITREQRGG